MVREQNLFQILKFSSSFICQNNLNIENYTSKQAIQDGNVVSVGDNIAFSQIRKLRGDAREDKEIFNSVSLLRLALRRAKRDGNQKAARAIARAIYGTLFVKDIISVESTKKSEYRKVAKAGFYVNGVRYVRFSASAGQIRHNTVLFVAADIYQQLYKILMCGLDEKVTEINIAKLSAYFSLSTSSVLWVTKPRVCIIKDFETTIPQQKIDWICNAEDGSKYVEERSVDVVLNSCDGQGLISPDMAAQWSQEMGLDYVSSSYVVRSIFVKGNLVPFDFRQYAHENGISTIKDRWGKEYNIDEVDVLLSESQFKMYKYYSSWEEYDAHVRENGIKWGVARYNRKYDDEWCLINYQYIQVLNMKDEDIEELIQPTIDWLNKVCTGDDLYALLYSLGGFNSDQDISYNDVYTRAQNLAMRAVIKDPAYLKDSYVQKKIYRNIVESINKAKLGKIWARGNYQFMISDPISQCRSAIGLDPTGEIPADNVYCNFWNTRTESDSIALARSPCLDKHEINVCKLYTSENTDKWYKYIKSGVIYSIYDTSVCRHSDSDFDGDIVYNTDNPVFLRCSMKNETNPIMYDKQAAKSQKICHRNFVETDIRGFGTKVGTYSNYSTIIEAMLPMFPNANQEKQREELLTRKKLLREINGQEIDRIKGVEAKGPDKEVWLKHWKINPEDSEQVRAEKYYHNSLVIAKKPYFFRYLYSELNQQYKKYESQYNEISKCLFRTKLKKLITKENKTDAEKAFVKRYHKFSPLISTNCTMNIMCRKIESIDFDIQYSKDCESMLPYKDLSTFDIDESILLKFRKMYQRYSNKKVLTYVNYIYDGCPDEDYKEVRFGAIDAIRDDIQEELADMSLSTLDALTYIKVLSLSYAKFNWAFAWDLLEDSILDVIQTKDAIAPVEDHSGQEYLGRYYVLKTIPKPLPKIVIGTEMDDMFWYTEGEI